MTCRSFAAVMGIVSYAQYALNRVYSLGRAFIALLAHQQMSTRMEEQKNTGWDDPIILRQDVLECVKGLLHLDWKVAVSAFQTEPDASLVVDACSYGYGGALRFTDSEGEPRTEVFHGTFASEYPHSAMSEAYGLVECLDRVRALNLPIRHLRIFTDHTGLVYSLDARRSYVGSYAAALRAAERLGCFTSSAFVSGTDNPVDSFSRGKGLERSKLMQFFETHG
jgi:hypothetical protein